MYWIGGIHTRGIFQHGLAGACKNVLLIQPSSAAAERAFSILCNSFGERQESSLQDYIECSIMLQYNGRGLVVNDTGLVVC